MFASDYNDLLRGTKFQNCKISINQLDALGYCWKDRQRRISSCRTAENLSNRPQWGFLTSKRVGSILDSCASKQLSKTKQAKYNFSIVISSYFGLLLDINLRSYPQIKNKLLQNKFICKTILTLNPKRNDH